MRLFPGKQDLNSHTLGRKVVRRRNEPRLLVPHIPIDSKKTFGKKMSGKKNVIDKAKKLWL